MPEDTTDPTRHSRPRSWVVMRRNPADVPDEPILSTDDESAAHVVAEQLGIGFDAVPVPKLADRHSYAVVHLWRCRATVSPGSAPDVEEPEQLLGASQLVLDGVVPDVERVTHDDGATKFATAIGGLPTNYLTAYAATAQRARDLVIERAESLPR